MKKNIFQIAAVFFLALCSPITAQEMPKIIPPSPEAASVFKFTEVPVSFYTGVPNITVPIFDIEARGMTIPINISYHARGNRVDEMASQVGLGWSLNYGGMISRQTRGRADEDGSYAYMQNDVSTMSFFSTHSTRTSVYNDYTLNNDYDFLPDQFYFNANNLSGKFLFDKFSSEMVIQKYDNIKLTHGFDPNGKIASFVLTDGDGNTYYFGKSKDGNRTATDLSETIHSITVPELGNPVINGPSGENYYNTWYLMDILTAQGELVEFFYEAETVKFFSRGYDELWHPPTWTGPPSSNPHLTPMHKSHITELSSHQNRLSKITFAKGRLEFKTSGQSREDIQGATSVSKIILYDHAGVKVKEFGFDYEFKTSPNDLNQNNYLKLAEPEAGKRMFLKSVQVKSATNDTLPAYRFKYNSTLLPNRHSNSQDLWGYYNGKNNGRFLEFTSADIGTRTVDTLKASAGILEKIIYPEGGSTTFHYEHNKVFNPLPRRLFFMSPNPLIEKHIWLTHLDTLRRTGNNHTLQFTIGENVSGFGTVNVQFYDETGCGTTANTPDCKFRVTASKSGTNTVQYFKGLHDFALPPGTWTLKVEFLDGTFDRTIHTFSVDIKWKEEMIDADEPLYAAGKRIKKIEYLDPQNNTGLTKTYTYNDPATGKGSGRLLGLPNFYSLDSTLSSEGFMVFEPLGAIPGSLLCTYQGNSVGYGTVTEYYGEGSNTIGKTEYKFSMIPDTGLYYEFPYHPPTDNEWLRGKEESIAHFKSLGSGMYAPVKKTETEYLFGDFMDAEEGHSTAAIFNPIPIWKELDENMIVASLGYLKTRKMFRLPIVIFGKPADAYGVSPYKTYHFTGGAADKLYTKTTDYLDGGSQIVTRIDYTYDYNEHYNPATVAQASSEGGTTTTKYFYPGDFEMAMALKPALLDLKTRNMVQVPLVTQTYTNANLVSQQETAYKNWGNNFLAPELLLASKGEAPLETKIRYNVIDNTNGNPLEVRQENGIRICYVWGYNKTQPIAKIENASANEIATALGVVDLATVNETDMEDIDGLRSLLPNAMVTTYTYKPLVGVTSVTDPKGNKNTYSYDAFNRLQSVRDNAGNVLSESEYHYRP